MSCNGCTDCCKVPVVWNGFQAKYLRWYKEKGVIPVGWTPISKRIAKKRNKKVVDYAASNGVKKPAFFRCTHLRTRGCEIHSTSPSICHDYPVYMKTLGEFKELMVKHFLLRYIVTLL